MKKRVSEDSLKEARKALNRQRYINKLLGDNPISTDDTALLFTRKIDSIISKIDSILNRKNEV